MLAHLSIKLSRKKILIPLDGNAKQSRKTTTMKTKQRGQNNNVIALFIIPAKKLCKTALALTKNNVTELDHL